MEREKLVTALKYLRLFCIGATQNDNTDKIDTTIEEWELEEILHFIVGTEKLLKENNNG